MEDKICHIFHHGLTTSIELYLPHPEGATVALLKMLNPASSSALTTIHLDSAGLTRVPSELTGFGRLENVHLSGNRIQSIDSGTFNFTATLKRLDLSSNGLTRIEPVAFKGQFELQFINCYWLCSKSLCNNRTLR